MSYFDNSSSDLTQIRGSVFCELKQMMLYLFISACFVKLLVSHNYCSLVSSDNIRLSIFSAYLVTLIWYLFLSTFWLMKQSYWEASYQVLNLKCLKHPIAIKFSMLCKCGDIN